MLVCGLMWHSCVLVFIASACTLVIELIAGRIMAPYVGVSLYTWTSIIGIVLAGMSVGNYLGGVVAGKRASPCTLGLIFIAGGVSCLLILIITDFIIGRTIRLSLLPNCWRSCSSSGETSFCERDSPITKTRRRGGAEHLGQIVSASQRLRDSWAREVSVTCAIISSGVADQSRTNTTRS